MARSLLRAARDGALAVKRPSDGVPAASRTLLATDFLGRPVILISGLSLHSQALEADARCSILVGRTGKGDPLAHPRMTIFATARAVPRDAPEFAELRERFLDRHPKAELYVDFPDFRFMRLEPMDALLNGGFGKAYELSASDLLDEAEPNLPAAAKRARDHMNEDHGDAVDAIAARHGASETGWKIATVDRRGFEVARRDQLLRVEFLSDPAGESGYRKAFVELLRARSD
ncbi:HugZ family pyridoxamine 5'-phosphate oxidase [Jiella marina]|uniref:HugZ family pyridoxamine 5'-phosphate oxidase n=1 Tax=Jiella sp. LLJ827 TaxID=2917712 RepID=UPI00210075A8|nr:DUF2470 domain-containing protein [Jiella sp. LLJ827]MCQ0986534.1 DUF2470 domain-containing protein [Jiella sp. LLJ827]